MLSPFYRGIREGQRISNVIDRWHVAQLGFEPRGSRSPEPAGRTPAHSVTAYCCGFLPHDSYVMACFLFFVLRFYIYLTERKRAQAEGAAEGEGEAGSPLSRESDMKLDPKTQGS